MEIYKDIKGEKLKQLFNFFNEIADKVSVERYCTEKIPENEFIAVQTEYRKHIIEADKSRRDNYINNIDNIRKRLKSHLGINNQQEANEYFDDLLNQDLEVLKDIKNDGEERVVNIIQEDVIKKIYTRTTIVTEGPIRQLYYLKKGKILKDIEKDMESLFSFPYIINSEEYENLTFYRESKPIFAICSHENFACIMLEDKQLKEFKKLGI